MVPMQQAGDDHEPDDVPCYRHPGRLTALHCIECERPICVDCVVQAPVGIKCPACARTSRAARGAVPTPRLALGVVAALAIALGLGGLLHAFRIPFIGIILAYFAGAATGAGARRASGGYRDPLLARAATVAAAVGMLALPLAAVVLGGVGAERLAWPLVYAAAAAYGAHTRAS